MGLVTCATVTLVSSPDALNCVSIKCLVSADDRELFDQRLRNQQTVERITVMKRKDCDCRGMMNRDSTQLDIVHVELLVESGGRKAAPGAAYPN